MVTWEIESAHGIVKGPYSSTQVSKLPIPKNSMHNGWDNVQCMLNPWVVKQ